MRENLNLGLEIIERERGRAGRGQPPIAAAVYLKSACSYLKGGAATLTGNCSSFQEFEGEVERLKRECDAILAEAAQRFAAAGERSPEASADRTKARGARRPTEPPTATGKTPLKIDRALRVEDRMTRDVTTLRRNDRLSMMDELMKTGGFRHVVVVEDDDAEAIAGVISHRDVFYGALAWSIGQGSAAHQKALEAMPVKQVMHTDVVTVTPDTPLAEAARMMLERRIGCLPVVRDRRLVGILSEGDFLSMITEAEVRPDR